MAFGLSAGAIAGLAGATIGAYGAVKSSKNNKDAAEAQGQLDPRVQSMLFGDGTSANTGLLAQYQALGQQPQSAASQGWANANANYLTQNGAGDLGSIRNAAQGLMQGNQAPLQGAASASLPAYAVGNDVSAPFQNNIDLTGSYKNLLGGGDTSALMSSLQAGNALTSAQFQKNQTDITNNLTRNVLPSIRGGAIAAGQYGSSRQGIAEGNALSDYTNQLTSANNQLSAANSANTANALAGAYENGQNRALSATQGLGAQQYGVASQNANTKNQAEFMNVGNVFDASKYNAGLSQQQGLANQQAQLTTNAQNNSSAAAGSGLLSGLLGQMAGSVGAQDNYAINKAGQVNGLLQPYLSGVPTQQSYASNSTAAGLGGALQGLQLGNQLSGLLGGGSTSSLYGLSGTSGIAGYSPATSMPNTSLPFLSSF